MRTRLKRILGVASLATCLLLGSVTACTPEPIVTVPSSSLAPDAPALRISAPDSPSGVNAEEGLLVAHAYAAALEAAGVKTLVEETQQSPAQQLSGLQEGNSDIVPGYSRDLLTVAAPSVVADTPAEVLSSLQGALPSNINVLDAAKAQDGDNLVVTAVMAEKYQLKTLQDLAKVCEKLILGGPTSFQGSGRGLAGLSNDYNCLPKKFLPLAPLFDGSAEDVLWALLRDDIQIADIHESAPAIVDNSLVSLTDTKHVFRIQNVVPLVAADNVSTAVQDILNKVSAALTTEELANLNRLSQDRHFGNAAEVAQAWLIQVGLVKAQP